MGIHLEQRKLNNVAKILNGTTMTIPIVYLGLLPGADTRRISTWQPIIDKMRRKLAAWRRRHLSFSGGICLVKSVLSSFIFVVSLL